MAKKRISKIGCYYCNYRNTNVEEMIKHEEYQHGMFRCNPRAPSKYTLKIKDKPTSEETKNLEVLGTMRIKDTDEYINVVYRWNDSKRTFIPYTDDLKFGMEVEIYFDNESQYFNVKNITTLREEYNKARGIESENV